MATKTPLQDLDPKLKKAMRDKVRSLNITVKCTDCPRTISSRSLSNMSTTETLKCPSSDCDASFQADMSGVQEVLKAIDKL